MINMITALTEKLGEEKIFSIIQDQMYGSERSQESQQPRESGVTLPGSDSLAQEHGCATTETSSGEKNSQGYWEYPDTTKKVKLDQDKQSLAQLDNNAKPQKAVLPEDFVGTSNDFVNYYLL